MDKNKAKPTKNEHGNGKRSKAEAGEGNKLKMTIQVLKDSNNDKRDPWFNFEDIDNNGPSTFNN